jgi:hypothetical protein
VKEGREVPRRGFVAKRDVLPDPVYNSKIVTRLINNIMLDGKKGVAQKIVYGANSYRSSNKVDKKYCDDDPTLIETIYYYQTDILEVYDYVIDTYTWTSKCQITTYHNYKLRETFTQKVNADNSVSYI